MAQTETEINENTIPISEASAPSTPNVIPSKDTSKSRCHICFKYGTKDELNTHCNCRGIFAWTHEGCLSQHLEVTQTDHCDVCRFRYNMNKTQKSFLDWIKEDRIRTKEIVIVLGIKLFKLYLLLLGLIVTFTTWGEIKVFYSCCLFLFTLFWGLLVVCMTLIYLIRQLFFFSEWQRKHFRIKVKPNLNSVSEPSTPPPSVRRASGIRSSSTSSSRSTSPSPLDPPQSFDSNQHEHETSSESDPLEIAPIDEALQERRNEILSRSDDI